MSDLKSDTVSGLGNAADKLSVAVSNVCRTCTECLSRLIDFNGLAFQPVHKLMERRIEPKLVSFWMAQIWAFPLTTRRASALSRLLEHVVE